MKVITTTSKDDYVEIIILQITTTIRTTIVVKKFNKIIYDSAIFMMIMVMKSKRSVKYLLLRESKEVSTAFTTLTASPGSLSLEEEDLGSNQEFKFRKYM